MTQGVNSQESNLGILREAASKVSGAISTFGIRVTEAKNYFERCSRKTRCNNWRKMHGIVMHRRLKHR